MIIIINVNIISAFDFDNIATFEKEGSYGKYDIRNSILGIPFLQLDKVAEYELTYNTNQCLINCEARGTAILYEEGRLFSDIKFKNTLGDYVNRDYTIYILTNESYQVAVNEEKEVCQEVLTANGTQTKCEREILGSHIKTIPKYAYKTYQGEILTIGNYEWKIEGKKNKYESIDWLGSSFGETFDQWAWWDANWAYRNCFDLTNNDVTLTNVTFNRTFDTNTLIGASKMENDCVDLRVVDEDTNTELNYNISQGTCNTALTNVYFKVDSFTSGDTKSVCLYYGNALASNGFDDWRDVFLEYDDFNGGTTINPNIWVVGGTNIEQKSGYLNISGAGGTSNINTTRVWQEPIQIKANTYIQVLVPDDSAYIGHGYGTAGLGNRTFMAISSGSSNAILGDFISGSITQLTSGAIFAAGGNYNLTLNINSTTSEFYSNGTLYITNTTKMSRSEYAPVIMYPYDMPDIRVDEIIISRYLSKEPTYGAFAGEESGQGLLVVVSLLSPANNSQINSVIQDFTANFTISNGNITNATLLVWNADNTLYATNFTTLSGSSNSTTASVSLETGAGQKWNYQACAINSTDTSCSTASANRSFDVIPFSVDAQSYSTHVFETDSENFLVNISTISNILSTSINLNYNGSKYFVETNCLNGVCELSKTIDIPLVSQNEYSENKEFFWELRLFDRNNNVYQFNTSTTQQNVTRINIGYLSGTTNRTLNFTTWDEQNRSNLAPMSFKATFDVWLGAGTVKRSNSFNVESSPSVNLSINPENRTFYTDAVIEYDAVGQFNGSYNQRNYHFQNASLTNLTQNIRLFLLDKDYSTSFIQRVVDTSQIAQTGVLIFQQRYYPEDDTYETVSISKTDTNGESVGFYQTEIPDYRHLITRNGTLLKTTERGKIFPQIAPYTIIFTIGDTLENAWESFGGISNIVSYLTFNESNNIITYEWIDTTGALSIANLTVDRVYANQTNRNFCNEYSQLTAGILTCNLSGQEGTFVAKGYIGRSPSVLDKLITITVSAIKDVLAAPFLLLWILFIIATIGIGLYHPPSGIILLIVGLIAGILMGVTAISWLFVFAIIAVGIWIMIETS